MAENIHLKTLEELAEKLKSCIFYFIVLKLTGSLAVKDTYHIREDNHMDEEYNNVNQDGYNNGYQPEYQQGYQPGQNLEPVMTIGQWLITALVMSIPCVNIVMLFVWGFGNGNQNRANYCKAALILWIISMALMFVLSAVLGSSMAALMSGAGAAGM